MRTIKLQLETSLKEAIVSTAVYSNNIFVPAKFYEHLLHQASFLSSLILRAVFEQLSS